MPIRAATMVVTPSPVMTITGVISQTCSWQRKSVPVPPRDPNHGCLLTATADSRETENQKMTAHFFPGKRSQFWTSWIRRKRKSNWKENSFQNHFQEGVCSGKINPASRRGGSTQVPRRGGKTERGNPIQRNTRKRNLPFGKRL